MVFKEMLGVDKCEAVVFKRKAATGLEKELLEVGVAIHGAGKPRIPAQQYSPTRWKNG
jgi:hypothetical protein